MLKWIEDWFLYRPVPARRCWVAPNGIDAEDVWLQPEGHPRIHAWWCPARQAKWTVLYCHGRYGNLSFRQRAIAAWQAFVDANVLIIDYPGFGRSQGKPTEQGCYAAGREAYRHLTKTLGIPPGQIVVYGGSLGGGVATELAVTRPHRALILAATFTSIPDIARDMVPVLPAHRLVKSRFDNLNKLRNHTGPVMVVHGTTDRLVPFSHGQRLFAATPSKRKQLLPIPGADHGNLGVSEFYPQVRQFLDNLAGDRSHLASASLGVNSPTSMR